MRLSKYLTEATQPFVLQEYLFGWYDIKFFKTFKEAKTFAQKKYDNTVKRNKKAEKDWRPNSYGQEQIHPMRIVDTVVSPVKYSPATKQDEKDFKKQKDNYLTEQIIKGRTTENHGHTHSYRVDAIGSGFTTFDDTKHIHAIGVFKVKTAHGHEHDILDNVSEKKVWFDVYENSKGETANVFERSKGKYYVEVDNRYDMSFQNKKKLKAWLKLHKMEHIGTDSIEEAKKIVKVKKPDFMVAMGLPPDYSVKEIEPDTFQIAKFTHGKEPTEVYRCQWTGKQWKCNCYSRKGSCKHVDIVQKFIKGKKRSVFDKWAKIKGPK